MSRHGPERDGHGFRRLLAARKVGEAGLAHDIEATDEERDTLLKGLPEKPEERRTYLEDVFWAVLNSKEFVFNH